MGIFTRIVLFFMCSLVVVFCTALIVMYINVIADVVVEWVYDIRRNTEKRKYYKIIEERSIKAFEDEKRRLSNGEEDS